MTGASAAPRAGGDLRVLIVMPLGVALGGGELMLRQLLQRGMGRGISWVVVFLRPGPMMDEARAAGAEVHLVDAGRFREVGKRLAAVRRIAAIARDSRADLVFGWMVAGQAMAGPAALLAGVPSAWYQVATPGPDSLDRFATLWPTRGVITLSRAGRDAQARIWPRRTVKLVHPGVSLDAAQAARAQDPRALRDKLGLPAGAKIVGIVGRLQRWKGMHVFLDALALLRAKQPAAHGVIVGGAHETEPGYPAALQAQATALGIAGAVTFAGFQGNAIEWMQAMDVVIHASDREPFGIVIVEGMALGKPVIAGSEGGPTEIITDGENGLLSPFGDANALAAAMERLLGDPALARRLGEAAARRAVEFSDTRYAANVVEAMRGFVAS
jgi:glycosyltransferase involved in cell wall biosynthesis